MRRLILISLLATISSPTIAQRGFSGAHVGAHFSGRFASGHGGQYARSAGYSLGPLFWDSLFPDDFLGAEYPVSAQPVIVIQQTAPTAVPVPKPAEPLLIELRGGRYVQISGAQDLAEETADQQPALYPSRSHASEATQASAASPSTVLVSRDGSREEIRDYTIANGVLYAQTNYYNDGSWNKQIAVSSLNLPATIEANRARGIRFQLPSKANEVIVGP